MLRTFLAILTIIFSLSAYAEDAPANVFTLTTTGFLDEGALPTLYTCDSKDISPELSWTNPPANTKTFTLIFSDRNAPKGTFYHWILFNIPKATTVLEEGITDLPAGTMVGKNSFDKLKYSGPCPPKGSTHDYEFKLYALDTKLELPAGSDAKAVLSALEKHIIGKPAVLTTVYMRWIH